MTISVAIGWRDERPAAERASVAAPQPGPAPTANERPALVPVATAAEASVARPAPGSLDAMDNGAAFSQPKLLGNHPVPRAGQPVHVAHTPAARPLVAPKRHPHRRTLARAGGQIQLAHSGSNGNPWASDYNPLARVAFTRTRAEVRDEYLASRAQVAAFSGEDSGSVWLARMAARRDAEQAQWAAHARNRQRGRHPGGVLASAGRGVQAGTG